ncbi:MAG: SpoIID/LytB domain-containing protein [Firmicutes bacterium]|nr:SpoIID/LytB domain-containing protein [Bacillota bacterium]
MEILGWRTFRVALIMVVFLLLISTPMVQAASLVRIGLSTIEGPVVQIEGPGTLVDINGNVIGQTDDNTRLELSAVNGQVFLGTASFSKLRFTPTTNSPTGYLRINGSPFRGDIIISAVGNKIRLVNELEVEDYLLGVVPLEMPPSWPREALKAQAVAARTFALKNSSRHQQDGFGLCDTSHCQAYGGVRAECLASTAAVNETAGLVMKYNGVLIDAFYHASSGGYTETAAAVWGSDRPYLTVVEDELDPSCPYILWQQHFTPHQLGERLADAGYFLGPVKELQVTERTSSGRAASVFVSGSQGSATIAATVLRTALNLNSTLFDICIGGAGTEPRTVAVTICSNEGMYTTDVAPGTHVVTDRGVVVLASRASEASRGGSAQEGQIYFQGSGYGHGVGLSQWGAKAMAEQRMSAGDDVFREILGHYYRGIEIEPYSY